MNDPEPLCSLLPWDSEFFGLRIGTVNATTLTDHASRAARDWAEANRIDCVYFLSRDDSGASAQAAEGVGFEFIETRLELACPLDTPAEGGSAPAESHVRAATPTDLPRLCDIARDAHRNTRFFRDTRFPSPRAAELYARWITRDFRSHHVMVATAGCEPVGYISVQVTGKEGTISLLAVDAAHTGKKLGRALVRSALDWLRGQGCAVVHVVTQGNNVGATRVYEACGFRPRARSPRFHLWLER